MSIVTNITLSIFSLALAGQEGTPALQGQTLPQATDRLAKLLTAAEKALAGKELVRSASLLEEGVRLVRRIFPEDSEAVKRLGLAGDNLSKADRRQQKRVLQGVQSALGDLTFKPLREAPLPAGWPEATPVDRLALKSYPAYRAAWMRAPGRGRNSMFMSLFFHIKKNKIAMTAPVEMGYAGDQGAGLRRTSMAFLYRKQDMGSTGRSGAVQVEDVGAVKTISMGLRGTLTEARLKAAKARLERWLRANADRYRRGGDLRVLGYNSPWVPRHNRYHEVQIPVVGVPQKPADDPARPATTRSVRRLVV